MLLSSPKARLITFFKTSLIKFYLNSQLMADPISHTGIISFSTMFSKCFSSGRRKLSLNGKTLTLFSASFRSGQCNSPGLPGSTLFQTTILDSSNLKEFADDKFEFDENTRKFSKRVENTVGKGEISRYEQFLLFQQCFQKTCTANT